MREQSFLYDSLDSRESEEFKVQSRSVDFFLFDACSYVTGREL